VNNSTKAKVAIILAGCFGEKDIKVRMEIKRK